MAGNLTDPALNLTGNLRRCREFSVTYYWNAAAQGSHLYSSVAVAILNVILSLFGTFANVLVLAAYARNKRLRTMANMLLMTLACSDLLVTAVVQPLKVCRILKEIIGSHSCLLWTIARLTSYFACGISVLTVVIITVERFITLAYPFRFRSILTPTRLKIVIAATWVAMFALIFSHLDLIPHDVLLSVGASLLFLSVAIIISVWLWIHGQIQRHRKIIKSTQTNVMTVHRAQLFRNTKTSYLVVVVLLVFYFPSLLLMVYFVTDPSNFVVIFVVGPWLETLMFTNSSLNPLLVLWRKRDFKETVRKVIF